MRTQYSSILGKSDNDHVAVDIRDFVGGISKSEHTPVLPGFDPTSLFIEELEKQFGDKCIFFYNQKCTNMIGMVWKPSAFFVSGGLRLNNVNCLLPVNREQKSKPGALPNIFQMISIIRQCGEGIIDEFRFVTGTHKIK